jgi:hypothetical protein
MEFHNRRHIDSRIGVDVVLAVYVPATRRCGNQDRTVSGKSAFAATVETAAGKTGGRALV